MTTHLTTRGAAALVTAVVALTVLTGCGGDDPYCAAVKEHRSALDSFGKKVTSKAFESDVKAVQAITSTAPDSSKDDWAAVGAAMEKVTDAQEEAGIKLEDMTDPAKYGELDSDALASLNKAYEGFNDTSKQRKAAFEDVQSVCDITLR